MNRVLVLTAGETLTDYEGYAIKLDGNYKAVKATAVTDEIIGILSKGAASAADVDVVIFGDALVRVSGTVKTGQFVAPAAAATCTAGKADNSVFCGIYLQNGVSGDLVPAFVFPSVYHEVS
jgi:hypothetical protein